jgi:hypothetical protein
MDRAADRQTGVKEMFTTMRLLTCSVALALLAGFVACTGGSLDLGHSDASTPPPSDAGGGVGTTRWTGYLENYKLPSGSDAIVLEITSGNAAVLTGTVVLGSRVLAPATDPNVGYPPGYTGIVQSFAGEGFTYHLRNGVRTDARLVFGLDEIELWGGWCALQTPYEVGPDHYECLPNTGTEGLYDKCFLHFDDGGVSQIDCGKMTLCTLTRPCHCTANGCTSGTNSGSVGLATLSFDLAIAGDAANGTVVGLGGGSGPVNVHLTRAR